MIPHPGEPITYVDLVAVGVHGLIRARVASPADNVPKVPVYIEHRQSRGPAFFCVTRNASPILFPENEGTKWIREHHLAKSEDGQALLAAYRLSRSVAA